MVQRRYRKQHLASRPGDSGAWVTVCDRDVQDDAVVTPLAEAQGVVDARADQVCAHCQRLILMAGAVAQIAHLLPRVVPGPVVVEVPRIPEAAPTRDRGQLAVVLPFRRLA